VSRRRADPPTLLVVGARGQVGYELVRELAPLGRVVAFTRAECDLADPAAAGAAVRAAAPTVVVNAAAYTAVDRAEQDAAACAAANAAAPGRDGGRSRGRRSPVRPLLD
jgi:dTDP-4-dehydrorhamnose reductase